MAAPPLSTTISTTTRTVVSAQRSVMDKDLYWTRTRNGQESIIGKDGELDHVTRNNTLRRRCYSVASADNCVAEQCCGVGVLQPATRHATRYSFNAATLLQ